MPTQLSQALLSHADVQPLRPLDIQDKIFKIYPAKTRLITLLMATDKVTVDDYEFKINQQIHDPGVVTATAVDSVNVTITVSTALVKHIRKGTTLRLSYDKAFLVKDVNYTTGVVTLDSVTGITAGDKLVIGGTGSEELSYRPAAITRIPTQTVNYVETQRDAWGASRHIQNVRFYGGARFFHSEEDALWEHKRSIDRGLWFNKAVPPNTTQDTGSGPQILYKTNGVFELVQTNRHEFSSGTVTWEKIRANLTNDTRYQLSQTLWLCFSAKGQELWDRIIYNKTVPTTYSDTATFGPIAKFQIAGKTIVPMVIDHFEAGLENVWVLIDPAFIEVVTTANKQTGQRQWMLRRVLTPENNTNGIDGTICDVLTDYGLRLHNEQAHAIWYNASTV